MPKTEQNSTRVVVIAPDDHHLQVNSQGILSGDEGEKMVVADE